MITKYLEDEREEKLNILLDLKDNLDLLETKVKENEKFIEVLQANNESYFPEFTPRDVNIKNKDKIDELTIETDSLREQIKILNTQIKEAENKLNKLDEVIADNKKPIPTITTNVSVDMDKKLREIISYLPADPMRARIELQNLIDNN